MRKSNIALLVAVVFASPLALANPPVIQDSYNTDKVIEDSYNTDVDVDKVDSHDKDIYVTNVGNTEYNDTVDYTDETNTEIDYSMKSDDDTLTLKNIGNDRSVWKQDNSDNSMNSTYDTTMDYSETWDVNVEIDTYMSAAELDGAVMGSNVTYGGACCDSGKGGSGGDFTVNQTNSMSNSFGDASGISIAGQNVGNNALVQQTTSTNAALVSP
ncbi:hypothetical protein C9J48_13070 [Photobacterium profundum]|uniref:Uncharacterized protein n=1 Tax=Photobacterium profundum 3TCK TaxID=314280 RepID=Q1Z0H1_9GAMM|nr:hypothetical protein [Photobacterium profundum]EAS42001.1 hypothetical protein P3TCK_11839 [Photobacterium profundum 3TCK]PSV61920.1 hypothetical protein C9J48_13070 [Photobacterium profundum]